MACNSPILLAVARATKNKVFFVKLLQSQLLKGSNVELFKYSRVFAKLQVGKGDLIFLTALFSRPFINSFMNLDEVISGRTEKKTELNMALYPLMAVTDSFLSSNR